MIERIRDFFRRPATRGARLLDRAVPGWVDKVDVASLDIGSLRHCILGQVYGDYLSGIKFLGIWSKGTPRHYGFAGLGHKEHWLREISARRMPPMIAPEVVRGAELLDSLAPGWEAKVDLDLLDVQDPRACLLGQVFGDWLAGCKALGIGWNDSPRYAFCGPRFNEDWKRLITFRRRKAA